LVGNFRYHNLSFGGSATESAQDFGLAEL